MSRQPGLFDDDGPSGGGRAADADQAARQFAMDPRENVVLEASAGTGKTTVLVHRYLNLLRAGVDPANILAITFTRKAAAEMHERIVTELRAAGARSAADRARWLELRDRIGEISIETIDAFCLSLLREFPLEAGLEPGFEMADETEVPRIVEQALDGALRIAIAAAREDADLALALAQLGTARARTGLAHLLSRRLVAREALDRFLARGPRDLTAEIACRLAVERVAGALDRIDGGLEAFLASGPVRHPKFQLLAATLGGLGTLADAPPGAVRTALDRVRAHFLTQEGHPRHQRIHPYSKDDARSAGAWKRHRDAVTATAPLVAEALAAFDSDLNVVLARGVRRLFEIAQARYRRALAARSLLDFSDLVERALALLAQMDEFAQSRFRLESRYHHVLVDEFQDTSRAQWRLVALLIQSWGEGFGLVHDAPLDPTIFVVGDRKQSIYRFRDADARVIDHAARFVETLRNAIERVDQCGDERCHRVCGQLRNAVEHDVYRLERDGYLVGIQFVLEIAQELEGGEPGFGSVELSIDFSAMCELCLESGDFRVVISDLVLISLDLLGMIRMVGVNALQGLSRLFPPSTSLVDLVVIVGLGLQLFGFRQFRQFFILSDQTIELCLHGWSDDNQLFETVHGPSFCVDERGDVSNKFRFCQRDRIDRRKI